MELRTATTVQGLHDFTTWPCSSGPALSFVATGLSYYLQVVLASSVLVGGRDHTEPALFSPRSSPRVAPYPVLHATVMIHTPSVYGDDVIDVLVGVFLKMDSNFGEGLAVMQEATQRRVKLSQSVQPCRFLQHRIRRPWSLRFRKRSVRDGRSRPSSYQFRLPYLKTEWECYKGQHAKLRSLSPLGRVRAWL